MAAFLRLRQVCLVAAELARQSALLQSIFGLQECYRDPNVAAYGLENVLFPIGTDFIEIVAPLREGTAAGRFLARHRGRYGYMIIMDCDDPLARQAHCAQRGVRAAHTIEHPGYLGVQLHPKDTGAAMLEFNRTEGGEDPRGPYGPAGKDWQRAIRADVTQRLLAAEIDCPDAAQFGARWADLLQRPLKPAGQGAFSISLDSGTLRFLPANLPEPVLAGIGLQVTDRASVLGVAREQGCVVATDSLAVCGMRIRLTEAA